MKKNIAHIITLTSLSLGLLSIITSFKGQFEVAAYLIFGCLFLDILDGTIARYLKTCSEFGKQLDSLSDFIGFGIAPAILMYNFINVEFDNPILSYTTFLIPILSALRLAKYNSETTQKKYFTGITTPVNGLLFSALVLIKIQENNLLISTILINQCTILILIVSMSILLITPIRTFNLRFDGLTKDKKKLFFIFISICMIYLFNFTGIPILILIYVLLSVFKLIN